MLLINTKKSSRYDSVNSYKWMSPIIKYVENIYSFLQSRNFILNTNVQGGSYTNVKEQFITFFLFLPKL
jgi:hypothetical protein